MFDKQKYSEKLQTLQSRREEIDITARTLKWADAVASKVRPALRQAQPNAEVIIEVPSVSLVLGSNDPNKRRSGARQAIYILGQAGREAVVEERLQVLVEEGLVPPINFVRENAQKKVFEISVSLL
jgi:hypothetical protein